MWCSVQCANPVLDLHSLNLTVSKRHIELKYINAMAIAYAHKSHVIYLYYLTIYYLLLLCLKNGMKIYEMKNDAWNWRLKYQNFLKFFTNNSLFKVLYWGQKKTYFFIMNNTSENLLFCFNSQSFLIRVKLKMKNF